MPWLWVKHIFGISNSDVGEIGLAGKDWGRQLSRIFPVIYEFQKQFFGPKKWNILWPAVLLALILNYRKIFRGTQRYITIYIMLVIAGYISVYILSPIDINFFLSRTWSRFILHFLPVILYWLAYILKDDVKI